MTDEDTRAYHNLILLCYQHHVETSDPSEYPIAALQQMKATHEACVADIVFPVTEEVVAAIAREAEGIWNRIDHENRTNHVAPDLRLHIDMAVTPLTLFQRLREALNRLGEAHAYLRHSAESLAADVEKALVQAGYDPSAWKDLRYWENPTVNRDWEILALGLPNVFTDLHMLLDQLELRHMEIALMLSPEDKTIVERLSCLRVQLLQDARSVGYVD